MNEKQINTEIRLADIRTALAIVWGIMLLLASVFIHNILISTLFVMMSVGPITFLVLERVILRD